MTPIHIMESIVGLVIFIPLSALVGISIYFLLWRTTKSFCGNCLKETHIENGICTTCNNKKVYHDD